MADKIHLKSYARQRLDELLAEGEELKQSEKSLPEQSTFEPKFKLDTSGQKALRERGLPSTGQEEPAKVPEQPGQTATTPQVEGEIQGKNRFESAGQEFARSIGRSTGMAMRGAGRAAELAPEMVELAHANNNVNEANQRVQADARNIARFARLRDEALAEGNQAKADAMERQIQRAGSRMMFHKGRRDQSQQISDLAMEAIRNTDTDSLALVQYGEKLQEAAEEIFNPNPAYEGEFLASTLPQGLGTVVPTLGSAFIPFLGPAAAATVSGGMLGEEQVEDYRQTMKSLGVDPDNSQEGMALMKGLALAPTEYLPVLHFLGRLKKGLGMEDIPPELRDQFEETITETVKRYAGSVGTQAVEEGLTEGLQLILSDGIAKGIYDPNRETSFDELKDNVAAGSGVGGIMGFIEAALSHNKRMKARGAESAQMEQLAEQQAAASLNPDLGAPTGPISAAAQDGAPAAETQPMPDPAPMDEPQEVFVTAPDQDAMRGTMTAYEETETGFRATFETEDGMQMEFNETDGVEITPVAAPTQAEAEPAVETPAEPEPAPEEDAMEADAEVEAAAHEAATSPENDLPEPTDAQIEAGNYKKGHVTVGGLDITIENPQGSTRSGTDPDGNDWSVDMAHHYGYIKRTEGADGDHVDVFVGPATDADSVFVVDQVDKDGNFDEHKVMMGFDSMEAAVEGYKANYEEGWNVGPVTEMSTDQFKEWVQKGNTFRPLDESLRTPDDPRSEGAKIAMSRTEYGESFGDFIDWWNSKQNTYGESDRRYSYEFDGPVGEDARLLIDNLRPYATGRSGDTLTFENKIPPGVAERLNLVPEGTRTAEQTEQDEDVETPTDGRPVEMDEEIYQRFVAPTSMHKTLEDHLAAFPEDTHIAFDGEEFQVGPADKIKPDPQAKLKKLRRDAAAAVENLTNDEVNTLYDYSGMKGAKTIKAKREALKDDEPAQVLEAIEEMRTGDMTPEPEPEIPAGLAATLDKKPAGKDIDQEALEAAEAEMEAELAPEMDIDTFNADEMPAADWDYAVANFPKPDGGTVRVDSNVGKDYLSLEEGQAKLAEWKAEAKRIGKEEDHKNEIIISLFDASGEITKPWREAGYTVLQYDIKLGDDLMETSPFNVLETEAESLKKMGVDLDKAKVVGLVAQPPCTCFSSSGARWWELRHDKADRDMVNKMFGPKASVYFEKPKEYTKMLVSMVDVWIDFNNPEFSVMENPVGRIATEMGLPKPTLTFQPNNYSDPYTKKTQLWGKFNTDLPTANVEPTEGSLMHKLWSSAEKDGGQRSLTPEGFSYAFFMANNTSAGAKAEPESKPDQETKPKAKRYPAKKGIASDHADWAIEATNRMLKQDSIDYEQHNLLFSSQNVAIIHNNMNGQFRYAFPVGGTAMSEADAQEVVRLYKEDSRDPKKKKRLANLTKRLDTKHIKSLVNHINKVQHSDVQGMITKAMEDIGSKTTNFEVGYDEGKKTFSISLEPAAADELRKEQYAREKKNQKMEPTIAWRIGGGGYDNRPAIFYNIDKTKSIIERLDAGDLQWVNAEGKRWDDARINREAVKEPQIADYDSGQAMIEDVARYMGRELYEGDVTGLQKFEMLLDGIDPKFDWNTGAEFTKDSDSMGYKQRKYTLADGREITAVVNTNDNSVLWNMGMTDEMKRLKEQTQTSGSTQMEAVYGDGARVSKRKIGDMTAPEIRAELDEISERISQRQAEDTVSTDRAGVDYLLPPEKERFHKLKQALPSYGEEKQAAKDRLKKRAQDRKKPKGDVAVTPAGREIEIEYKVVEADDLIMSNDAAGNINPAYPEELQPRDRTRAASVDQIKRISGKLNPALVGKSNDTTTGAPIIGPDNVVESGNGRSIAIKNTHEKDFVTGAKYRDYLEEIGFEADSFEKPVLVRVRKTDLDPDERLEFVKESNERTTLSMSATEQAMVDAEKVRNISNLYAGGDIAAVANRDFVKKFMQDVLSEAERGEFIDSNGIMSQAGKRRIEASLMAAAYGDSNLVQDVFESTDSEIKAIGNALLDASGVWAQMRMGSENGSIAEGLDITPQLMEAVNKIRQARAEGKQVKSILAQDDMFAGSMDRITEQMMSIFYRGENYKRARSREKVAEALIFYANKALATQPGEGLFGDKVDADQLTEATVANVTSEEKAAQQQGDLLSGGQQPDGDTGKPKRKRQGSRSEAKVQEAKKEGELEDFGETLHGARKHEAALEKMLNKELTDADMESMSFAKIWPKKEIDQTEDPVLAALMTAIRDSVPSKPRHKGRVRRWVGEVKAARALAQLAVARFGEDNLLEDLRAHSRKLNMGAALNIWNKAELLSLIPRDKWKHIKDIATYENSQRKNNQTGQWEDWPYTLVKFDTARKEFDSTDMTQVAKQANEYLDSDKAKETTMEFEVRQDRTTKEFHINKKGDPEYRSLKSFKDKAEAFDWKNNRKDELAAEWEKVKERDNVGKRDVRNKENRERVGEDYRQGKDVTPEQFSETFGFRGVQFGNWVKQGAGEADRQGFMNQTFDALMDLANVVGIPPSAISLEGRLGLAFGARGKGWASAHYEQDNLVINLTKTRGAGSLAHEWFHALDNYFQMKRDRVPQTADGAFITTHPEEYYMGPNGYVVPKSRFEDPNFRPHQPDQWQLVEGVRPQIAAAWAQLVEEINKSGMTKRSAVIDQGRGYWSNIIERGARSFEGYVIHKLNQEGKLNDFLANVKPISQFKRAAERYPYLLEEEMEAVAGAFDHLMSSLKSEPAEKGTRLYSLAYHGTPHYWDSHKADLERVGTGEGAQAYGYGLYFAELKSIAEYYRDALSSGDSINYPTFSAAKGVSNEAISAINDYHDFGVKIDKAFLNMVADNMQRTLSRMSDPSPYINERLIAEIRSADPKKFTLLEPGKGNLYQVKIPDSDRLLDYDQKIADQPKHIKDAVVKAFSQLPDYAWDYFVEHVNAESAEDIVDPGYQFDGGEIYQMLSNYFTNVEDMSGDKAASHALNKAGIPGLKYLDADSRGPAKVGTPIGNKETELLEGIMAARFAGDERTVERLTKELEALDQQVVDEGTRNFVIWDESVVDVQAVNDQVIAAQMSLFSLGGGRSMNTENLTEFLETLPGMRRAMKRAIKTGKIKILDKPPAGVPPTAQGWADPDGSVTLVASNLSAETALPVLMHESFHSFVEPLLGTEGFNTLVNRLGNLYNQGMSSQGKAGEFWAAAMRSVAHGERAGVIPEGKKLEEFGAYAIEHYEKAPKSVKRWVDDLIGHVKAWFLKAFDVQLGDITPGQLRSLAGMAITDMGSGLSADPAPAFSITKDAKAHPDYWERNAPEGKVISKEESDEALQVDATAKRILAKGNTIKTGDRVGIRLNINVLNRTGVPVQTVHKGRSGDGYKSNKGWWGGEVLTYLPHVTLTGAYFNVGQKQREKIASGEAYKSPMASIDGEFLEGEPNFDGVEIRFNPHKEHLFTDTSGRALKYADEVTIMGHRAYARGNLEFYESADAPARAGDTETDATFIDRPGKWFSLLEQAARQNQSVLVRAFKRMAELPDAFRNPKSNAKRLEQIMDDMKINRPWTMRKDNVVAFDRKGGTEDALTINDMDSNKPYIQIHTQKGEGGSALYQAGFTWAHNNGKTMQPDVFVTNINRLRRTEAMISSILRHGTSKHLQPHHHQYMGLLSDEEFAQVGDEMEMDPTAIGAKIPPEINQRLLDIQKMMWEDGNHDKNLHNLLVAAARLVEKRANLVGESNVIESIQNGFRVPGTPEDAGSRDTSVLARVGAGDTTLRRYAVTGSLLSASGSDSLASDVWVGDQPPQALHDDIRVLANRLERLGLAGDGTASPDEAGRYRYALYSVKEPTSGEQLGLEFDERPNQNAEAKAANQSARIDTVLGLRGVEGTLLGSAVFKDFKDQSATSIIGKPIESAEDLAALAQIYRNPGYETLRYIFTKGGKVVYQTGVSSRMAGASAAFPGKTVDSDSAREFIQGILDRTGADGFYMVHNHPSGDPRPSDSDVSLTNAIYRMFPNEFQEHVVVNHDSYAVIYGLDDYAVKALPKEVIKDEDRYNRSSPKVMDHKMLDYVITAPADVVRLGQRLRDQENVMQIVGRNRMGIRVIFDVSTEDVLRKNNLRLAAMLRKISREAGAGELFAVNVPKVLWDKMILAVETGLLVDAIIDEHPVWDKKDVSIREVGANKMPGFEMGRIGNPGREVREDDGRLYSLRPEDHFDDITDDQRNFLSKIGPEKFTATLRQRWNDLKQNLALRIRQAGVDRYAALLRNDKLIHGHDTLEGSIASSSWVLARMSDAAGGALTAMVNSGRIYMEPNEKVIDVRGGTQGLADVLRQLGHPAEIDRFFAWVAANRSKMLMEQGRENLFDEFDIEAGLSLSSGRTDNGGSRGLLYAKVWNEFQQYRDDVLTIADTAGLLKKGMDQSDAVIALARKYEVDHRLVNRIKYAEKRMDILEARGDMEKLDAMAGRHAQMIEELETLVGEKMEELGESYDDEFAVLTTDQKELWMEEFYVPFYRVLDDDGMAGPRPGSSGGITRQQAYKHLKGGTQHLNDLLENTLMNFHHLLQASLKNQAAQQAIENAQELGIAEATSENARDKKISTFVLIDGEKHWFNIHDPLTFKALHALADTGMNGIGMKIGRAFKRFFTDMTTITPQFVVANALRDTLSAMATSPVTLNPAKNAMTGMMTYGNDFQKARMLATGASFSFGHIYGQNPEEIKLSLGGNLQRQNLIQDPVLIPKLLLKAWRHWHDITDFAENINRAAIFAQNQEAGAGKLKAAFEARDLVDFGAKGDAKAVRIFIDLVPFLNARIQGLDKLYRSGIKTGIDVARGEADATDKQNFARFGIVVGALSLVSMALYLANYDDEEYRKLEDWQRDTYWVIRIGDNMFFIPKPFEVGAIATMTERLLEQAIDPSVGGEKFAQRFGTMIRDTFSFDPAPQAIRPLYELAINENRFTGRPIESMGHRNLSPSLRVSSHTTKFAQNVSAGMESMFGLFGYDAAQRALSPVQIDHLIQGYMGQVGAFGVGMADTTWRTMMGEKGPAKHWYEYQPVRRFYRNLADEESYNRYGTLFYDTLDRANTIYADVRNHQKLGEADAAVAKAEEGQMYLDMRKALNKTQRRLGQINREMKRIMRDKEMSAEAKRLELDQLRSLKNLMLEDTGKAIEERKMKDR